MSNELDNYRREIDGLDEQIIRLLKERLGVVKKVGEFKQKHAPEHFPIRPGREASMVRRIVESFQGSNFSPAAAAQIWRIIIGTSTALEADLSVSVLASAGEQECFWLAREYFGPAASIIKQPHIKRVISDVIEGVAAIGVVPQFSRDDATGWWTHLVSATDNPPKIFAQLPFASTEDKSRNAPTALAFAKLAPENSGDDVSVYVLEIDHDVSQHRLQMVLAAANLSANWINVASLLPNVRHHLIEIKGFVPPEHPDFQAFISSLGNAVQHAHFLGAYATPLTIK